jgi:integrase
MATKSSPKYPRYTFKKGKVFYFTRVVPQDLCEHYSRKRIVASLRTTSFNQARILANTYSNKLEQYWLGLRLEKTQIPGLNLIKTSGTNTDSLLPSIIDAKELYFSVKGKGKPKLFFDTANRNIRYLIDCLDNRSIDCYSTKDAAKFREWLIARGFSNSSLQRIFSGVKAIVTFCIKEQGLDCQNPFTRVYLPAESKKNKRLPVSSSDLRVLSQSCIEIDDDIRWLVALIINTGMGLSEAIGLLTTDLNIDSEIPFITIQPHKHRRLKTDASERTIPLTGISLWAAKQIKQNISEGYCFPRYVINHECKSNSASATVNKWIKSVGSKNNVIHGLRHSFRDRLREVEAPLDMVEQMGGWSLKSVGQTYGNGYNLELTQKYLIKIADNLRV